MLAKKYKSEVVSISNPFNGIYSLEFKSLGRKFKFQPGQFLHLAIDSEYDGIGQWPDSRCFSMQSNPNNDTIKITYAVNGSFTKDMEQTLKPGSEVWLKLPYGDLFQQPHSKVDTVFIAGGTGITPFLSLFTHESFQDYINPSVYLGYRSEKYFIYNDELEEAGIKPILFFEDINGLIDIDKIVQESNTNSIYFISGPPLMIKTFKGKLIEKKISSKNILTDDWE
ncbi:MAG: FAD-dependent oxidoreductase [Bacteroidales bacterium]